MARTTADKKRETHARIVRTAAAAIRRHGYAGASVAEIMEQSGLTHGGFYAHFASRDAMLAEAIDHASAQALESLGKASAGLPPGDALAAVVSAYLSDRHLTTPERGCTLAAVGTETRRQTPEVRAIVTRRAKELADLLARQMQGWGETRRHEDALGAMCTLVGAMVIARLVDEPSFSNAVRSAAATAIHTAVAAPRAG